MEPEAHPWKSLPNLSASLMNVDESLPNLKTTQALYVTPSIASKERNPFPKLSIIKTQISINHVGRKTELSFYSL